MEIRLTNPTNRNTPARVLEIGNVDLYFSYKTLIGVRGPGVSIRRDNEWGSTTGRHFNEMNLRDVPKGNEREVNDAAVKAIASLFEPEL